MRRNQKQAAQDDDDSDDDDSDDDDLDDDYDSETEGAVGEPTADAGKDAMEDDEDVGKKQPIDEAQEESKGETKDDDDSDSTYDDLDANVSTHPHKCLTLCYSTVRHHYNNRRIQVPLPGGEHEHSLHLDAQVADGARSTGDQPHIGHT